MPTLVPGSAAGLFSMALTAADGSERRVATSLAAEVTLPLSSTGGSFSLVKSISHEAPNYFTATGATVNC